MYGPEISLHRFKGPWQILFLVDLEGIDGRKPLFTQVSKKSGEVESAVAGRQVLIPFTVIVVQVYLDQSIAQGLDPSSPIRFAEYEPVTGVKTKATTR